MLCSPAIAVAVALVAVVDLSFGSVVDFVSSAGTAVVGWMG